jgi:hypothetical protein
MKPLSGPLKTEMSEALAVMTRHARLREPLKKLERWLHDPASSVPREEIADQKKGPVPLSFPSECPLFIGLACFQHNLAGRRRCGRGEMTPESEFLVTFHSRRGKVTQRTHMPGAGKTTMIE